MVARAPSKRQRPWLARMRAVSHKVTWWLGTRHPDLFPLVFVVGYPKSGTTWVCQVVADYMQLPFPRGSLLPVGCKAVVHGHETVWPSYRRGVYVMRDGRDVMVSLYFHLARELPGGDHPRMTRRQRRMFPGLVNKDNVQENLPRFIEAQVADPFAAPAHWGDHVASWLASEHDRVALMRYEDMLADGKACLGAAMERVTGEEVDPERIDWAIQKYAFKRQSGRKAGAENRGKFLRKGQAGDWKNHFTREAAEVFDDACGASLVAAGYEPDNAWVRSCPSS